MHDEPIPSPPASARHISPPHSEKKEITNGDTVMITNLDTNTTINGTSCRVIEWITAKERWKVHDTRTNLYYNVKTTNLTRLPRDSVTDILTTPANSKQIKEVDGIHDNQRAEDNQKPDHNNKAPNKCRSVTFETQDQALPTNFEAFGTQHLYNTTIGTTFSQPPECLEEIHQRQDENFPSTREQPC